MCEILGKIDDSPIVSPLSLVSLVSHVSLVLQGLRIRELLRFICEQLLLGLVRDFVDWGDVVCAPVSVEHVRRDLELATAVQHCRDLVDFVGGEQSC